MSTRLTKLPKTQFSGLDYDNIIEDITHLIVDNPEYNENWDYFLSSNAGRMIVELFAYIADQLATRIDWNVNENFLSTATQKKSIIKILKLIGYGFALPTVATVPVTVSFDRPVGNANFGPGYVNGSGSISPFNITAQDKSGKTRNFELLSYDNVNNEFDYKTDVILATGSATNPTLTHSTNFYEGTTIIETFTAETDNNPIFTLNQNPISANSVKVFFVNGNDDTVELLKVNSFLDPEAQQEQDDFGNDNEIPYILTVQEDDVVTIEFGSTSLLSNANRRLTIGDKIRVFYRIGGGSDGNITVQSINTTKQLSFNGNIVNVDFTNLAQGTGGLNAESSEQAIAYAPLQVRTANKTVTEEDYDITLGADNTILKAKSYGNANFPSDLLTLYGEYIKPLEVWNFILKDQSGWENIDPSRYNDFEWISLRLENRFNEMLSFVVGSFNDQIAINDSFLTESGTIDWDGNGTDTFKNYAILETTDSFHSALTVNNSNNIDFRAKLSFEQITENFFDKILEENIFISKYANASGAFNGVTPSYQLKEDIPAWFLSRQELSGKVDTTGGNNLLNMGLDNRTNISALSLTSSASLSATQIVADINSAFTSDSNYMNTASGTVQGYQEFGLSVADVDMGFTNDTDLYFRVNGIEYSVNTGTTANSPTTSEFVALMNSAFSIVGYGDIVNEQDTISNISSKTILRRIKEGWRVAGTGIPTDTFVGSVNILTEKITLVQSDGTTEVVATASNTQTELTFYPFYATFTGGDIRITNVQRNPVGPVWIEDGTFATEENNLLSNSEFATFGYTGLDASVDSTGVSGWHEFGINGATEDTHGFQTFDTSYSASTDNTSLATTTQYYFKLDIDGGGITEYNITTAGDITVSAVIALIDAAITAAGATCDYYRNHIRIYSDTLGSSSTISITAGTTGTDLIGALGTSVDTAVVGVSVDSGLAQNTEYYFKINGRNHWFNTASTATPITYEDIETLLDTYLGVANHERPYTASVEDPNTDEWNKDIRITHNTKGTVYLDYGTVLGAYQEFTGTSPTFVNQIYEFKLKVDGSYVNSGNDISVSFAGGETLAQAAALINTAISSYGATCSVNTTSGKARITSNTTGHGSGSAISIEPPTDGNNLITPFTSVDTAVLTADLFLSFGNIDRLSGLSYTSTAWSSTDNSVGGGDYQYVAKRLTVPLTGSTEEYILIQSPCAGEFSSLINFSYHATSDIVNDIFGLTITSGQEVNNYGYQKATIITNDNLTSYGDIIFDYGSHQLIDELTLIYVNYLSSINDSIVLGNYRNTQYATTDPAWRIPATRIYNTYYDDSTNEIDIDNSNFIVKFTKQKTDSMSIYSIDNDWTLTESVPAQIESLYYATFEPNLNNTNYNIEVNIDDRGKVQIDITGDNGADTGTYEISTLVANINSAIQTDTNYSGDSLYANYSYATAVTDSAGNQTIVIKSPINTSNSKVELTDPASNDATDVVFNLSTTTTPYAYTYLATGDYYIEYSTENLIGDFTSGSNIITNISDTDMAKVAVGMRILEVSGIMFRGYITAVGTNQITVTLDAFNTSANETFQISEDRMILKKLLVLENITGDFTNASNVITNISTSDISNLSIGMRVQEILGVIPTGKITAVGTTSITLNVSAYANSSSQLFYVANDRQTSNVPDLSFYFHYIFDKRIVDGAFDGEIENAISLIPGFVDGSLDEDVYKESILNKKVVGIENVFKQTKFSTFDVSGTVYYDKVYSASEVQENVVSALQSAFSLENSEYAQSISRSKVMNIIHGVTGVNYVEFTYFGKDATDTTTNEVNTITATFDEIIVLSEDIFVSGSQTHGIDFNYEISE